MIIFICFISSPEPLGSQGELIGWPCYVVRRRCRCRRCRRCRSHFSIIFFFETALPINFKFHVEHPYERGTKVCINGPGHMTKMVARAINSKHFKNLLLQNQTAYDFETWHEASGNGALQSLYKS